MLERLAAHPEVAYSAVAVWILIVIWIVSMVHWMIEGDVEIGFGLVAIAIGLVLGVVALNPPRPVFTPIVLVAVVVTVATFLPLRGAIEQRELVAIEIEALDRAYKQLDERPGNVGARFKIARLIYRRGLIGHAITVAEDALKGMPEEHFAEEHKQVELWRRQDLEPADFRPLPCVECGMANAPGELYCGRCGAKFLLDHAKGRWIGRTLGRKILAGWVALMGLFVGIPVAALVLPGFAAILGVVGISILVLTVLYAAFLGEKVVAGT